ncbi:hypothetical protein D3C76_1471600 [compost metagenome]
MGMLAHQGIEFADVDPVAGKPELHFELILLQLAQGYGRRVAGQQQRRFDQVQQPITQTGDPALPTAPVAAAGDHLEDSFGITGHMAEALLARPFEQAVKECPGVGAPWEAMDITAVGHDLSGSLRVQPFVIEQLLRLWAIG